MIHEYTRNIQIKYIEHMYIYINRTIVNVVRRTFTIISRGKSAECVARSVLRDEELERIKISTEK